VLQMLHAVKYFHQSQRFRIATVFANNVEIQLLAGSCRCQRHQVRVVSELAGCARERKPRHGGGGTRKRLNWLAELVESSTMNAKLRELYEAATELPAPDRAELAGMLLETLDGEPDAGVEAAWAEEVERRVRQVDAGEVEMIPWEQVRAELFGRMTDEG